MVSFSQLSLRIFREHSFGIDGDENAATAGQDVAFFVENFRGIDVPGSANFDFASLDKQGFVQGDRLEVLDRHLTRQGDDMAQLVYLTHGVVENGGDDSSVAVAWRTGVAFAKSEAADRHLAVLVEGKFKAHAVGIVHAASEAVILLHAYVASVVAVTGRLSWHAFDSIARCMRLLRLEGVARGFSPSSLSLVLRPTGACSSFLPYRRLTPWAAWFRRFAARFPLSEKSHF
jgi:hypothetical protein